VTDLDVQQDAEQKNKKSLLREVLSFCWDVILLWWGDPKTRLPRLLVQAGIAAIVTPWWLPVVNVWLANKLNLDIDQLQEFEQEIVLSGWALVLLGIMLWLFVFVRTNPEIKSQLELDDERKFIFSRWEWIWIAALILHVILFCLTPVIGRYQSTIAAFKDFLKVASLYVVIVAISVFIIWWSPRWPKPVIKLLTFVKSYRFSLSLAYNGPLLGMVFVVLYVMNYDAKAIVSRSTPSPGDLISSIVSIFFALSPLAVAILCPHEDNKIEGCLDE
jgi:hypothetical protein